MKFAVFGTGGVGGYFGGRLAQAGHDVTFIARGRHLAAIKENGLRVESGLGDFIIKPASATDNPASIGPVDVILVAVKAWDIPSAAESMKPMIGENTLVIPLENGVDAVDLLSASLGREHILGGLCRISSFISAPGLIKHIGVQPSIAFGELDNRKSDRVERILRVFQDVPGLTAEIPDDIHKAIWQKFIFIVAVSGVGAVTRQPIGKYRSVPETREIIIKALEEVVQVGKARGISLDDNTAETILVNVIDNISEGTIASMQKDIMEGRPSELEAQTGAVVRMGKRLGVPTPINDFLYACLLPMELKAREKSL